MKWKRLLSTAFDSIRKNTMRTLLTMLGIIIGVSAVIVMVAVGQGTQEQVESDIGSLGTNLIMVMPGASSAGGVNRGAGSRTTLTTDDVEAIRREAPLTQNVSPLVRAQVQIVGGGSNWSSTAYGVSPEYAAIKSWSVQDGTFFEERDIKTSAKLVILGSDVAEELFGDADPIGQQVRLGNVPFRIKGVMSPKGQTGMGTSQDDLVLVPYTTAMNRLTGLKHLDQILASAASADRIDATGDQLEAVLRRSHNLSTTEENDFQIRTQDDLVSRATSVTETLTVLLSSIAGVSLVVGGIGVMNIMLVSVTERTREIGLRLALGARGRDVLSQFLVESVLLSGIGGAIGVAIGLAGAFAVGSLFGLTASVDPQVVTVAVVFSAAVGIFFGYYPARKAAALNPIEALRFE